MKTWMWFVLMTIVCWGAYVPTIHAGSNAIDSKNKSLWAFLFVGAAYFLTAVIVPAGLLASRQDLANFPNAKGTSVSLLAGVLGALGALGVILAIMDIGKQGSTIVPPLVFAGAPIVATIIGMVLHRPSSAPQWQFFAGIVLAAAGAAMVLRYKPS